MVVMMLQHFHVFMGMMATKSLDRCVYVESLALARRMVPI